MENSAYTSQDMKARNIIRNIIKTELVSKIEYYTKYKQYGDRRMRTIIVNYDKGIELIIDDILTRANTDADFKEAFDESINEHPTSYFIEQVHDTIDNHIPEYADPLEHIDAKHLKDEPLE